MTKTTKNTAPIASTWMGKDANGVAITVVVKSLPIEGNDLREVEITSKDYRKVSESSFIGKNWFRKSTRIG